MINDNTIRKISEVFCGDNFEGYIYKSGPDLVKFFNLYFSYNFKYGSGFPSRWLFVSDVIKELIERGTIDTFFNIILDKKFIMNDSSMTEVEAVERVNNIVNEFNRILEADGYYLAFNGKKYHLLERDIELELIGSGGFANVYKDSFSGTVIKKLKNEYISDAGIRSRFKREFTITESLQDIDGVVKVFSYNDGNCSYSMEQADNTLERYVKANSLSDVEKLSIIRQILGIMTVIHQRNIIHRDLSPNNIFLFSNKVKIADFGLGKDLNYVTSHQTLKTNAVGQYFYCAPEQFMMLKDADKRSDVFSLGRIINFIMTGDQRNTHHIYRNVVEKATNNDVTARYSDASQLSLFFEKSVIYHNKDVNETNISEKLISRTYDSEIESYIFDMNATNISKNILNEKEGFIEAIIAFMNTSDDHAQYIIQSIDSTFRDVCKRSFEDNDPFAYFASKIIIGNYSFIVREIAAKILRYIAWDVNRFSAQRLINQIIENGIEPMIEDLLQK